jgi:uncharacterized membrane protein YtjA (UPF0391 family)
MLKWIAIFLFGATIAAILGFTNIAAEIAGIAKVIFVILLILVVGISILGYSAAKNESM